MSKTTVVILNFNGKHFLQKFLPSLIEHSAEADISIIDNASTDDSGNWVKENYPAVHWIELSENLGFAGGYNEGLKKIDSEYFVIINSDVEVTAGWLSPLIEFLDSHQEYASCQPKILAQQQKNYFEYAGASGGYLDSLGFPYCRGRVFDTIEEDKGQYDDVVDIFWSTGACMVIRSDLFFKAGGFDSDFFAHMEEIDLCWRIHSMGYRVACIPDSVVYHVGGGTLSKQSPKKTYLNFRNGLSLLYKNSPAADLWKLPVRMILDWLAAIKFGIENGIPHTFAVLKAHWHFILLLPKNFRKRNDINHSRPLLQHSKPASILFPYFVKGKKKYQEL